MNEVKYTCDNPVLGYVQEVLWDAARPHVNCFSSPIMLIDVGGVFQVSGPAHVVIVDVKSDGAEVAYLRHAVYFEKIKLSDPSFAERLSEVVVALITTHELYSTIPPVRLVESCHSQSI